MNTQLSFRNTQFDIANHSGQIWLRGTEIAKALGMEKSDAVSQIYNRNSDEFTEAMTLTLKLSVKGFGNGKSAKDVRVFSLRGAHLIAMFARTEIAKEFRKWVLDILDKEVGNTPPVITPVTKVPAEVKSRYRVRVIIYDEMFGNCLELIGKADTFRTIASGIATDLGFKPTGFVAVQMDSSKFKRIY
ncbi:Bro-N domain-containing protein [Yersinia thracica]|uniref:BRO-N domain-containing protein n=1 Tax=Yersinia thracica TaxID=2890319 RepID=UPI00157DD591|nr:Bro-N domain-containing protein [Yersinia thracica]